MKTFLPAMRLMMIAVSPAAAQTSGAPSADDGSAHATYQKFQDLKWERAETHLPPYARAHYARARR
jgi:hypothetical protein